jgi:hypothetical protein
MSVRAASYYARSLPSLDHPSSAGRGAPTAGCPQGPDAVHVGAVTIAGVRALHRPSPTKAGQMRSLKDLDTDALKVALDASDALMQRKQFLPRGGLLLMLVSRFRDDTREALGMEAERYPGRGREHRSLDELTSVELGTVSGAVMILLQDRFTRVMDDPALPKLLDEFQDKLTDQRTERAQIRASMAP